MLTPHHADMERKGACSHHTTLTWRGREHARTLRKHRLLMGGPAHPMCTVGGHKPAKLWNGERAGAHGQASSLAFKPAKFRSRVWTVPV